MAYFSASRTCSLIDYGGNKYLYRVVVTTVDLITPEQDCQQCNRTAWYGSQYIINSAVLHEFREIKGAVTSLWETESP